MKYVKEFTITRPNREPDKQRWELVVGMYCPSCGKPGVWHPETDPGDFYVGETHICVECSHHFTIQQSGPVDNWYALILAKLQT